MWGSDQDNPPARKEAKLRYRPGVFEVITPGSHVVCAVTGAEIPLDVLRYWSVEYQEAYASAEAALKRARERRARRGA